VCEKKARWILRRNFAETASSQAKDAELKKKDSDYAALRDQMKLSASERDALKRERDELVTKVMKLDMEIRHFRRTEEFKYQVAIMRLKKEVEELQEELKREQKGKLQMDAVAADIAAPALTYALARVRARRNTATGAAAPGKPEDTACRPPLATAASAPASSATGAAAPAQSERGELKRERDELETKVMNLDMEIRNIKIIEERKYQVEIMRHKQKVEDLK
jgi:hypothetical protein